MKLACLRCKQRKTKCDRAEPVCHQCVLAKVECHYVERRKRPRLAQQKVDILSKRLELLEKQVVSGERDSSIPPPALDGSTMDQDSSANSTPDRSPPSSLVQEDGQESWIYRMATDARRNFEANTQSQAPTPTPQIDSAMSTLNEALDDLGKLKIRSIAESVDELSKLKNSDFVSCLTSFEKLLHTCVVPDIFVDTIDWKMFRSLPSIINSPYINIEPVIRVLYWNGVHYGLEHLHGSGVKMAQAAYIKLLESVPDWLDTATASDMDCQVAALTTWTAINNLDFQLSYKFHSKACHFLKLNGTDRLDVNPSTSHEEESRRELTRFFYWQIVSTDHLYRLFFNKPSLVRWSVDKVKLPAIPGAIKRPRATQVAITSVWGQYSSMTARMLRYLDEGALEEGKEGLCEEIDRFCLELEELIADWKLLSLMKDETTPIEVRFLIADHVMTMYAIIIGMERQVRSVQQTQNGVDPITLRAARQSVDIILHFFCSIQPPHSPTEAPSIFILCGFISFYPFCAIFSLYSHILACPSASECENDLQSVERLAQTIAEASAVRKDFVPLSRTIQALNRVARTIQEERRAGVGQRNQNANEELASSSAALCGTASGTELNKAHHQQTQLQGLDLPTIVSDSISSHPSPSQPPSSQINGITSPTFDYLGSGLPFLQEYPNTGEFEAYGFMRAVESDFIGRNWHDDWWDVDMGGMLTSEGLEANEYNLPTPNT